MKKRKICIVTGSRAEFGLLYWLIKRIMVDQDLKLQLVATGMHLSSKFGLTYKEIENHFNINEKINIQLSSDTSIGISKSMSIAQRAFSKAYNKLKPDIVVVLGDRYEIFSAATAAMIAKIPIAHIHGGEITEGSWDDSIRHCISKMAHLHFTATKEYSWYWFNEKPINFKKFKLSRSQDLKPIIRDITFLYGISKKEFMKKNSRIGSKPYPFIVSQKEAVDINESFDLEFARNLYKKKFK